MALKGKTRITINRDTLKDLLEVHIAGTLVDRHDLNEFTIHRNGSIEMVITPVRTLPLADSDVEPGL